MRRRRVTTLPLVYIYVLLHTIGLSLGQPVIEQILHEDCSASTAQTILSDCPRDGGNLLTIIGQNLDSSGNVILGGLIQCEGLVSVNATVITCSLPAGITQDTPILYIATDGSTSLNNSYEVSLSYLQCTPGSYQDGVEIICVDCDAGTYTAMAGLTACVECEAGKSQTDSGQSSCDLCEYGRYKNQVGTGDCDNCEPGSYNSETKGVFTCTTCETDYYQDDDGQTSCHICPDHATHGQNHTNCLCHVGYYAIV